MKKLFHQMAGVFTLLLLTINANAQLTPESLKANMIKDWERAKAFTKEYIEAMPEDGINFKATPEVRSFAEQFLHLTNGTVWLISNGTGATSTYAGKDLEKTPEYKASKAALLKVVMDGYDYAISSIQALDTKKYAEKFKSGQMETERINWINKAFEHQTHHRGQTTIYLRLKGITPPAEKLF